ncbi:hypothetical protein IW261DRAFT_1559946 [Armillaria novae-zelandiae]|uniref:Uncharacterized protein n=1 Tax=Armillaria novae-zelandiae TaxID=153914 RepID=A0AA39PLH8_9AGAR|nr:hypothetical protein IW261DRAFT_1559946 [Armillaria novae-zelandiae]
MGEMSEWHVSPEQKQFLWPYLSAYRQVKKTARTKPKAYAQFQSQLWLLWHDRFRSELLAPDHLDIEACNHWYACRQEDLALIVQTLEFWEPFYMAGRKLAMSDREKESLKKDAPIVDGGDSIQRSGRVPKPRKFLDYEL